MNNLWAPWRIKYFGQKKVKGCIFCRIYRKRLDKRNFVILRSQYCFVMLNIFPYNNGHLMVIANRHIKSLEDLNSNEILNINTTLIKTKRLLEKVLNPQGFNIGLNIGKDAGSGVDKHLHFHLVPRWRGDTNFMPVLADTKIISQSLKDLYIKLKAELK